MKKYMMNLNTIEAMNPELYNFLMNEVEIACFSGNCIPVVDITTGQIYGNIGLDKYSVYGNASTYHTTKKRVVDSITNGTPFSGYGKRGISCNPYTFKDYYDTDVQGHYFMDVGSMDLKVLRALWKSWNEKEQREEKKKCDEAKLIKKYTKINKELDEILAEIKAMI